MHLYYFISVNCQWSAWSWRGCSKSCGYGVQYGYRRKVRYARNGGRRCYGGTSTRRSCSVRRTCPRRGIINVLLYYHLNLVLTVIAKLVNGVILRKQITIMEVIGQENHHIGEDVNTETILKCFGF